MQGDRLVRGEHEDFELGNTGHVPVWGARCREIASVERRMSFHVIAKGVQRRNCHDAIQVSQRGQGNASSTQSSHTEEVQSGL